MNIRRGVSLVSGLAMACLVAFGSPAIGQDEPSVGNLFIQAFDRQDEEGMRELIKTRTNEFPMEVKAMVEYAMSPRAIPEEQDFLFQIAYIISKMYEEETGDGRLLGAVKSNYEKMAGKRKAMSLPKEAVEQTKKDLGDLGEGTWRINTFKLDQEGALNIEIDVKESSGGGYTPQIGFKESQKAKEIVKKNIPNVHKGKIVWSSMGIGLKTVFLD